AVSTADGDEVFGALSAALACQFGWVDVVVVAEEFPPGVRLSVADESTVGDRERDLMACLSRYLRPWLRDHFAAAREQRDRGLFTGRESEVAGLIAQGLSNLQIARRLSVNVDTVKKHLLRAMDKAQCTNRTQLALFVLGHPFPAVA